MPEGTLALSVIQLLETIGEGALEDSEDLDQNPKLSMVLEQITCYIALDLNPRVWIVNGLHQ